MLRNVAVLALDGIAPFELGVFCEVFGTDRTDEALPFYNFAVCSPGGQPVQTSCGYTVGGTHGLDRLDAADLVAVPAMGVDVDPDPEVIAALRRAADRGAWIVSACTGSFVLARAGLLDGRRCTTHWMHAAELVAACPAAKVEPDVLYVQDDRIVTGAGTAAGIDACLHVLRVEHGSAVANSIARRMVVPPHREGGQRQYVQTPVVSCEADTLAPLLEWMVSHLNSDITVESLATRALTSPRTFARRFLAETGTTPHQWLTQQRLLFAEQLLEDSDEPVETVAERSGFGSAAVLRRHFQRHRRTTPQAYRRAFRHTPAA